MPSFCYNQFSLIGQFLQSWIKSVAISLETWKFDSRWSVPTKTNVQKNFAIWRYLTNLCAFWKIPQLPTYEKLKINLKSKWLHNRLDWIPWDLKSAIKPISKGSSPTEIEVFWFSMYKPVLSLLSLYQFLWRSVNCVIFGGALSKI